MADAGSLRELNTGLVRARLAAGGAMSKTALAAATGLSFPTVSRTVDALVESGEVTDEGAGRSTGGRAAHVFALNPMQRLMLLLRLEGEELSWVLCDRFGSRLESGEVPCRAPYLAEITALIAREQARCPQLGAVAFGIAANVHQGVLRETTFYHELRGVNLAAEIAAQCGIPVAVENDVRAASMGYWAKHCGELHDAVSCIYIGGGCVGSSTVLHGEVLRGSAGLAGEVVYLPLFPQGMAASSKDFARIDMTGYYGRLLQILVAVLNPERVVLYDNPYLRGQLEKIRAVCAQGIPEHALPQMELSADFAADYEQGLAELAKTLLAHEEENHAL